MLQTWKWSTTVFTLAVAIVSFSYSLVREVSLSKIFSNNPIGRHLAVSFLCSFILGCIQVVRSDQIGAIHDALIGDYLFFVSFSVTGGLAVWYLFDQLRTVSPVGAFRFCRDKIDKFTLKGIGKAKDLAGQYAVTETLNTVEAYYETLFQLLGSFIQKDTDGLYDDHLIEVSNMTSAYITMIQGADRRHYPLYRKRIKFITEKYMDHLLVLSQKNHDTEAQKLLGITHSILRQAAGFHSSVMVACMFPIKTAALTLIRRGDRVNLIRLLRVNVSLLLEFSDAAARAAFLYVAHSVLLETILRGDRGTLNDVLYLLSHLEKRLPLPQKRWLYTILWGVALKAVESSAYAMTGALIQTVVARFDPAVASQCLERLLKRGGWLVVPSVSIPITVVSLQIERMLEELSPPHEFIQSAYDYSVTKLVFLWYGQRLDISDSTTGQCEDVGLPNLTRVEGRWLHYFRQKLSTEQYGLVWTTNQSDIDRVYLLLCKAWKKEPTIMAAQKATPRGRGKSQYEQSMSTVRNSNRQIAPGADPAL